MAKATCPFRYQNREEAVTENDLESVENNVKFALLFLINIFLQET